MKWCLPLFFGLSLTEPSLFGQSPKPVFAHQLIDDQLQIGYDVTTGDVNGDGKIDIILADQAGFRWYRNPDWKAFPITRGSKSDSGCIAALDINGDGTVEIALGTENAVVYFIAPEDPERQHWKGVALPNAPSAQSMHWLKKGSGEVSLIVQSKEENESKSTLIAYSPPHDPTNAKGWKRTVLHEVQQPSEDFTVEREGILAGGINGLVRVALRKRKGPKPFLSKEEAGGTFQGIRLIQPGPNYIWRGTKLLHYTTIEPLHGNEVVIYRPVNGRDGLEGWKRTVIDDRLNEGKALACHDLVGSGREQIIAGWGKPNRDGKTGINLYQWDPEAQKWITHTIDPGMMATEDLCLADLNDDGKMDIIATGRDSKNLMVYWNQSDLGKRPDTLVTTWKKHEVWKGGRCNGAVGADFTGDGLNDIAFNANGKAHLLTAPGWKLTVLSPPLVKAGGIHCEAMDVDRDGDIDFIDCPRMLTWMENPGHAHAANGSPWKHRIVDTEPNGIHCVKAADVNQDGQMDLIVNQFNDAGPVANSIMWYQTPTDPDAPWKRHIFAKHDGPGGTHYMGFGDLDGDQYPDISVGAKGSPFSGGNWYAWWKNPGGAAAKKPWKRSLISDNEWCATNILHHDIDGDGDSDLVTTHGHETGVYWFENLKGDASIWKRHDIDPLIASPHCLVVADIDEDGDVDAATCGFGDSITAIYLNNGKGNFTVQDLDHQQKAYDIRAVDLDQDRDLDLLIAGQGSNNVVWYENPLR